MGGQCSAPPPDTCLASCPGGKYRVVERSEQRELPRGASLFLERQEETLKLCCQVGWLPGLEGIKPICLLIGRGGEKIGELGADFVPFVRNGIQVEHSKPSQAMGSVKLTFQLSELEAGMRRIIFALKCDGRDGDGLCDLCCAFVKMSKAVKGNPLLCEASTSELARLTKNAVVLAQIARDEEGQRWRFDAVAQCLSSQAVEAWVRVPFDDPDHVEESFEGDLSSPYAVLAARAEKLQAEVEKVRRDACQAAEQRHQLTLANEGLHILRVD